MIVDSLFVYPVKGMRGIAVDSAQVAARGFLHDRRWLVIDENDCFITQRENSALATIDVRVKADGLYFSANSVGVTDVLTPEVGDRVSVTIWRDQVDARVAADVVNNWLSDVLDQPVRLVFMDQDAARTTSGHWGAPTPVSFADGYPFLITTTASLKALNDALENSGSEAVGIERFRPNIVVTCDQPWADDKWRMVKIGDVSFDYVKPCVRCVVTTKDQQTGASLGKEPLKTLSIIRRSAHSDLNGALFGWNAVPEGEGIVRIGDEVTIIEERPEAWPIALS